MLVAISLICAIGCAGTPVESVVAPAYTDVRFEFGGHVEERAFLLVERVSVRPVESTCQESGRVTLLGEHLSIRLDLPKGLSDNERVSLSPAPWPEDYPGVVVVDTAGEEFTLSGGSGVWSTNGSRNTITIDGSSLCTSWEAGSCSSLDSPVVLEFSGSIGNEVVHGCASGLEKPGYDLCVRARSEDRWECELGPDTGIPTTL